MRPALHSSRRGLALKYWSMKSVGNKTTYPQVLRHSAAATGKSGATKTLLEQSTCLAEIHAPGEIFA